MRVLHALPLPLVLKSLRWQLLKNNRKKWVDLAKDSELPTQEGSSLQNNPVLPIFDRGIFDYRGILGAST